MPDRLADDALGARAIPPPADPALVSSVKLPSTTFAEEFFETGTASLRGKLRGHSFPQTTVRAARPISGAGPPRFCRLRPERRVKVIVPASQGSDTQIGVPTMKGKRAGQAHSIISEAKS